MIFRSGRSVLTTILTALLLLLPAGLSRAQTDFEIRIETKGIDAWWYALYDRPFDLKVEITRAGRPAAALALDIAIPNRILALQAVSFDSSALLQQCEWEYLSYRLLEDTLAEARCPSDILQFVALMDLGVPLGVPDLDCDFTGELFRLTFELKDNLPVTCAFVPLRFTWLDCGSNGIVNLHGDSLWVADTLIDSWVFTEMYPCGYPLGAWPGDPATPTQAAMPPECLDSSHATVEVVPNITLINGGIECYCLDIHENGDLNQDGLSYTLFDQAMFLRYFLWGDSVLPKPSIASPYRDQQAIAATDCNGDGITLTVADFVRLVRVIAGEESPGRREDPIVVGYDISAGGRMVVNQPVGAAYVTIEGDTPFVVLPDRAVWDATFRVEDNLTHVLIYSEYSADAFSGPVLTTRGVIRSVELGAMRGTPTATTRQNLIPDRFVLYQNYPNPFNPTTSIEFALPVRSDYRLTIYNAQGQEVETWQGRAEAGLTRLEWDGSAFASGVYFYKVEALGSEQTRKMLLVK